ncbi:MAG: hypothetical protein PHF60_05820 [Candidatus ainarchaeum sp.]|nr:hypothetical protein [Candidatus ainarchaeum sp.]
MEKTKINNLTLKALAGTVLALLFAVAIFIIADAIMPFREMGPGPEGTDVMPYIFMAHTFLLTAMLLLSLYLLFTYLKDYLQLKSRFTLGIIFAIFSFMLFALTANPLLMVFLGVYGDRGPFQLIPYLFATIALAILGWVSSK